MVLRIIVSTSSIPVSIGHYVYIKYCHLKPIILIQLVLFFYLSAEQISKTRLLESQRWLAHKKFLKFLCLFSITWHILFFLKWNSI